MEKKVKMACRFDGVAQITSIPKIKYNSMRWWNNKRVYIWNQKTNIFFFRFFHSDLRALVCVGGNLRQTMTICIFILIIGMRTYVLVCASERTYFWIHLWMYCLPYKNLNHAQYSLWYEIYGQTCCFYGHCWWYALYFWSSMVAYKGEKKGIWWRQQ